MARRFAACVLSAGALLSASACTSQAQPAPTVAASRSSAPATKAPATQAPATQAAASTGTAAPCANGDLKTSWGYGTQSMPLQVDAVAFTNVGDRACTLQGYPGVAITDGGTVINAVRVLNGYRGDLPPLTSPPLVILAPAAHAYAVVEWLLRQSQACYPAGTGTFEITAPDTTNTIILSTSVMGRAGICSGLKVNPVVPGTFGA
jgi:uncharacterized protein DUF4232